MALLDFGRDKKPTRKGRPAARTVPTRKQQTEAQTTIAVGVGLLNALGGWLKLYQYPEDPLTPDEQTLASSAIYGVAATSNGTVLLLSQLSHFGGPYGELVRVAALISLPRLAVRGLLPQEMVAPLFLALVNLKEVADGEYVPDVEASPADAGDTESAVPLDTGPDDVNHWRNGDGQEYASVESYPDSGLQPDPPNGAGPENGVSRRRRSGQRQSDAGPAIPPDTAATGDAAVVEVGPYQGAGSEE